MCSKRNIYHAFGEIRQGLEDREREIRMYRQTDRNRARSTERQRDMPSKREIIWVRYFSLYAYSVYTTQEHLGLPHNEQDSGQRSAFQACLVGWDPNPELGVKHGI